MQWLAGIRAIWDGHRAEMRSILAHSLGQGKYSQRTSERVDKGLRAWRDWLVPMRGRHVQAPEVLTVLAA